MEQVTIKIIDMESNHVVLERFTQQSAPILTWSGADDNFKTIMASEFSFDMLSENAEDGRYLDLFTGDESRYMVTIEKFQSSNGLSSFPQLLWRGYLLPDMYSEPYKNVNFFVNFTATDGLGLLKDKYFNFLPYDYNETVIKIIAKCLKKTNLFQDIHVSEAFKMEAFDWHQIYLNSSNFRGKPESGVGSTLAGLSDATDYDSCYDVLESILKAMACTLFSYGGKWYVIGWNKKHLVLDSFKVYDFHGNFKQNSRMVKNVHQDSFFYDDLMVYANAPLAYVDVSSDLDFDDAVYEDLGLIDVDGFGNINHDGRDLWNAGAAIELGRGDPNGEFVVESSGMVSTKRPKNLTCVSYKLKPTAPIIGQKYISLKQNVQKFIGKQYESLDIFLEVEIELFTITSFTGEQSVIDTRSAYERGFYRNAFPVDIYVGNVLKATSRKGHPLYRVEDAPKISFRAGRIEDEGEGKRVGEDNKVTAVWKTTISFSDVEGFINVRLYQPLSSLSQITHAEYFISKIEIKQVQESKRFLNQGRNINFSKKEKHELDFWESKSDLTFKNFKVNYDSAPAWLYDKALIPLSNRIETETQITYEMSITDGNWLRKNYNEAVIIKGIQEYFMKDIFGDFNILEGYYLENISATKSRIVFNKNSIKQQYYLWKPFDGFEMKTYKFYPAYAITWPGQEPNRDQSLKWKRYGSQIVTGYGYAYGRSVLDVKADMYLRLDGSYKKILSPLDIIRFKWIEDRNFWVSNISLDFSNGNSKVILCECSYKNVNDNGIFS